MPTLPKIPKNIILDAALHILIRDGFPAVNIKTIAKELGCSTQPISWHFGNMDSLRTELGKYAFTYADQKSSSTATDALCAFTQIGYALSDMAFDEPNLYRFLFLDGNSGYCIGGIDSLTELKDNCELIELISSQNSLPYEFAAHYLENMMIYTVGLLSLCVSGVLKCNKKDVQSKMQQMSKSLLKQEKIE